MTPLDFAAVFPEFRAPSWAAWRDVLAKVTLATRELYIVAGRGSGKSRICALLAAAYATREYMRAPGERVFVGVFAPDRKQARLTYSYTVGLLRSVPELEALIEAERRESLDLKSGVTLEIITSTKAAPRGRSYALAVVEEAAFLPAGDSAEPDLELVRALRPALARVPGSLLAVVSSPYARRGVLFEAWKRHAEAPADHVVLVQAPTSTLNPLFNAAEVERLYAEDPVAAASEYGAEFRSDLETYVERAAVEALVVPGRLELPPVESARYCAFVDPSGGSRDSFTLAVGHVGADDRFILDALRERRPPFSPEAVVAAFAGVLKSYGVSRTTGDRYAGEFPRELFRKHGITYELADKPKSDFYRDALALLNSRRIELLDHPRLIAQVCSLERRTSRGGKDSIDHPPGGHDDLANVVLGLAATTMGAVRQPALTGDMFFEAPKRPSGFERDLAPEGVRDRNFWMSDE